MKLSAPFHMFRRGYRSHLKLGVLVAWGFMALAQADTWVGVWRITAVDGSPLGVTYHLAISGAEERSVRVFDETGRPLIVLDTHFDEAELNLVSTRVASRPLPLSLQATRTEGRLEGEWTHVHPQYPTGGQLTGIKVSALSGDWQPFKKLRKRHQGPFLDATTLLCESEKWETFEDFSAFWDQEVESNFYLLLQDLLYSDRVAPEKKEKELRRIFAQVKRPGAKLDFVLHFPELVESAIREVTAQFPDWQPSFHIVSTVGPSAVTTKILWSRPLGPDGGYKCCSEEVVEVRDEVYLLFDPFRLASRPEIAPIVVKRQLFTALLWPITNQSMGAGDSPLSMEIFRRGLALHLALQNASPDYASFPGEGFPGDASRLQRDLYKATSLVGKNYFPHSLNFAQGLGYRWGRHFARSLTRRFSTSQLAMLQEGQIGKEWTRYLTRAFREKVTPGGP
jgi:hypothetical protein